jgi:hypothetical protein
MSAHDGKIAEGLSSIFEAPVRQLIEAEIKKEMDSIIDEAQARLRRRTAEIAAGIAIRLMGQVSFKQLGSELHIIVDWPNKEGEK